MALPKDFQFTDNEKVNDFAGRCAALMFGARWKHSDDLKLLHHSSGSVRVLIGKDNLKLQVESPMIPRNNYAIACRANDGLENPSPSIPAMTRFRPDGRPLCLAHYSGDQLINPPDGTPSQVNYEDDGSLGDCWYVDDSRRMTSDLATKEEIAKRMDAAKRIAASAMCDISVDVIALSAGNLQSSPPDIKPRLVSLL